MSLAKTLATAAALAAASPAAAQLSNRSIAVESGLSTPLRAAARPEATVALAATAWLDGDLEAVARVALPAAPRSGGRAAPAAALAATAGIRLSLLPEPLRPQVSLELGWARVAGPEGPADRLALGAALGLEWFPARDLSVAVRCAVRGAGDAPAFETVLGAAAYF